VSDFERALKFTLSWEGGYSHHHADPGGATMRGIIQTTYDSYRRSKSLERRPVRYITEAEVRDIYYSRYWVVSGAHALPWPLSLTVFDAAVNMGPGRAREFLNNTRRAWGLKARTLDLARGVIDQRVEFYYRLARARPSMQVFLKGWLNRARALKQLVGY
jgi:lysozyme family protein